MTDDDRFDTSLTIERTLDAPIARVWKMWTESNHFRAWYGPMGAKIPVAEIDARVGGKRLISMTMETPNGSMTMWFTGEYLVVDATTRLVYTESMSDETGRIVPPSEMGMPPGHPDVTEIVVELEDLGSRTKMVLTHRGVAPDSGGAMGWKMALDKLSDYLVTQSD